MEREQDDDNVKDEIEVEDTVIEIKKKNTKKGKLHPRNPHSGRYNFDKLCAAFSELKRYVKSNPAGDNTIDFTNPYAVRSLNQAILAQHYKITNWEIPEGYLCPPIPGRADYIHYLADLLSETKLPSGKTPTGKDVRVLDVGCGASCIYPIIGSQSYGWRFVGTEIDPISVKTAQKTINANPKLKDLVEVDIQYDKKALFKGFIHSCEEDKEAESKNPKTDHFDLTLCNPPFHGSRAEAQASNRRKRVNLRASGGGKNYTSGTSQNFGGQAGELWCPGGEKAFLNKMATESVLFKNNVTWFTSLVSQKDHLHSLERKLKQLGAKSIKVVNMEQGQKLSRFIAWSFIVE